MLIYNSAVSEFALTLRQWADAPSGDFWKQGDLISFPECCVGCSSMDHLTEADWLPAPYTASLTTSAVQVGDESSPLHTNSSVWQAWWLGKVPTALGFVVVVDFFFLGFHAQLLKWLKL